MQSLRNSSSGTVAKGEVMCFIGKASVPRLHHRSYTIKEVLLHWQHKVATNTAIIVLYQVERKKTMQRLFFLLIICQEMCDFTTRSSL